MKVDRIQIEYDLTFTTPFHCGTGIREGLIDRTIVRDREQYLYVPGSTFKGVLRERCEQLARFYGANERVKQRIRSPHDAEATLQEIGQTTTMVTRIFGSQMYPGRLFFNDARQENTYQYDGRGEDPEKSKGKYRGLQVDVYTQVRLDRPTRTAVRGALYTSEFGIKNTVFKGGIRGWLECDPVEQLPYTNLIAEGGEDDRPTYSLLLLLAGLSMIERLGGNKSIGKGQCTCEITQVKIRNTTYAKEKWQSWLEHLHVLSSYPIA